MSKRIVIIVALMTGLLGNSALLAQTTDIELKGRLQKHVNTLADDSMAGRKTGTESAKMAADYIAERFMEIGIEPYDGDTFYQQFSINSAKAGEAIKGNNVLGVLHSDDPIMGDEYIVIGAHFDHVGVNGKGSKRTIYNGADDNASGVATMIEVARMLKEREKELRRSVLFIGFDGEKLELAGAQYFVDNSIIPLHNIFLMINIDMVGHLNEKRSLNYYGTGNVRDGANLFTAFVLPEGYKIEAERWDRILRVKSDADPFVKQDVSTFTVTTGAYINTPRPNDRAETLDYDGMSHITYNISDVALKTSIISEFPQNYTPETTSKDITKRRNPIFTFGVVIKAGTNFQHYTSGAVDGKRKAYLAGGVYSNIRLNRGGMFLLRPEVNFERVGAKHPGGTIWMNGITTPLHFVVGTPSTLPFGAEVKLGGYYSYRFNGRQGAERIDFADTFYRNEAGLSWGIGFRFLPITLSFEARYAITNFTRTKSETGGNIRNRARFVTLSYTF